MNGLEIIQKFHNYVSDQLDSDFELSLANDAKNAIESELQLEITKKLDTSLSVNAGETSSVSRSLPADFLSPLPIYVGTTLYHPISFEGHHTQKDSPGFYWIDLANNSFHLSGIQTANETVYFYYNYETPDILINTSPVWPKRFHSVIPLQMARIYFQIDLGEKNRAWTDEYERDFQYWKGLMTDWDAKLKLTAIGFSA